MNEAMAKHKISLRKASSLFATSRKNTSLDHDIKDKRIIKDFALKYPAYGYRMITAKLNLEGYEFNHKKVYRIYKDLRLGFNKSKKSRKIPAREKIFEIANSSNQIWSLDFMSGRLTDRQKFRTLNIIDEFGRESLMINISSSIPSKEVINILTKIINYQSRKPLALRIDNGSELTSYEFANWANINNIALLYIQAGKPYQNCYIERFNGTYRREVLNKYLFANLNEAREITDDWLYEYNYQRPHSSLNNLPPKIFLQKHQQS